MLSNVLRQSQSTYHECGFSEKRLGLKDTHLPHKMSLPRDADGRAEETAGEPEGQIKHPLLIHVVNYIHITIESKVSSVSSTAEEVFKVFLTNIHSKQLDIPFKS